MLALLRGNAGNQSYPRLQREHARTVLPCKATQKRLLVAATRAVNRLQARLRTLVD